MAGLHVFLRDVPAAREVPGTVQFQGGINSAALAKQVQVHVLDLVVQRHGGVVETGIASTQKVVVCR